MDGDATQKKEIDDCCAILMGMGGRLKVGTTVSYYPPINDALSKGIGFVASFGVKENKLAVEVLFPVAGTHLYRLWCTPDSLLALPHDKLYTPPLGRTIMDAPMDLPGDQWPHTFYPHHKEDIWNA